MPPGFIDRRMPAEWEPHAGTWLFWPTRADQYLYGSAGDFSLVRAAFLQLIDVVCAFEPVRVAVSPPLQEEAQALLRGRALIDAIPLDDAWARDAAPTFVLNANAVNAVCWHFTGWGGRFGPIEKDAKASRIIAAKMGVPVISSTLGMEGGGVHSDGRGTILTTSPVLEDPGRNSGADPESLRRELAATLGASRVVSLPCAFDGDDTGGHIDVIAAFAPSGAVLLNDCADTNDPNSEGTRANKRVLQAAELEVAPVPQPEARFAGENRLAYSYLNFYLCNGALILPTFGSRRDDYVRGLFQECFSDREIIPLDARPFYLGGGGIHCVTQQIPKEKRGGRQAETLQPVATDRETD